MPAVTFCAASVTLDGVEALVSLPSHWNFWFWLGILPKEKLWGKFVCLGGQVQLYEWIYFGWSF